jgi:predicted RND superfamily exporter protein
VTLRLPADQTRTLMLAPLPSAVRRVSWLLVSIITLVAMALSAPWIARAALSVIAVDGTTPLEWVPPEFAPRQAYDAFTTVFDSGDVAVVTWPGCELGSPALERLAAAVTGPDAPRAADGAPWFDGVATGTEALEAIAAPPLDLGRSEAVERLTGMLVGPDGRTTCAVIGFTQAGILDRRQAVAWLEDVVHRTVTLDETAVHMAGPVIDNVHIDRETASSLNHFALPAGLVVLAVTTWALRSVAYAAVVWLVSAWCVGLSFATLHACGDRMNAMLIVMPVLVLVLGVAGGIHLVNYLREALAHGGRSGVAARGMRIGWLPCSLSAGTTAIGLFSLTASRLEPIRTFGFHAAIGVVAALVAMFLVVPGLFERWPIVPAVDRAPAGRVAAGSRRRMRLARWPQVAAALVVRHAAWISVFLGATMAAAATGLPFVRTSVRIDTLFRPESRVIRDYAWIERAIGPLVPIEVVVRFAAGHDVRPAERLELVQAIEERLAALGDVSGVVSAATFLPEMAETGSLRGATRKAIAARRLERSLASDDTMKYVRNVAAAEQGATPPGGKQEPGTVPAPAVDQLWRVTARVPALRNVDYGTLLDLVRTEIAPVVAAAGGADRGISASCTGVMPLVHSIQHALLGDLFRSFLTALGIITVVMIVVERSVGAGLLAMVSNVFPMLLLFGLLGWTRTPLDIGSVMTASIALGMAIDGTLHFLTFYRRTRDAGNSPERAVRAAFRHCAGALVECAIVCGLGILVFAASSFAPTSRFAVMLAGLLVAALVGDLVLLPALLVGPVGRRLV